ncbi:hypothetical protein JCM15831A_10050 [Asaia astilbis]
MAQRKKRALKLIGVPEAQALIVNDLPGMNGDALTRCRNDHDESLMTKLFIKVV